MHGPVPALDAATRESLLGWLRAGGRLLCTAEATGLPAELGLESMPPDDARTGLWLADEHEPRGGGGGGAWQPGPLRGFAAFGAHPLFEGLGHGVFTWAPQDGEPLRELAYRDRRPSAARVVAVERRGTQLDAGRLIGWEYEFGSGGILCLGAFVVLQSRDPQYRPQLEALLANAIVGQGIPHAEREADATGWPEPGTRAVLDRDLAIPEFPGLDGPVSGSQSPVGLRSAASGLRWTVSGHRLAATGTEAGGLGEVWAYPLRVVANAEWRAAAEASEFVTEPEGSARTLRLGARTVTERWLVPLDLPVLVWDVAADGGFAAAIAWTVDLRRQLPYPAGALGNLRWRVSDAGDALVVAASGSPACVVVHASGARLVARAGEGPVVEVTANLAGPARIVIVAANDAADLARAQHGLGHRDIEGLAEQRRQHGETLLRHGLALEGAGSALRVGLEWAKVRLDAHLVGTPGVGRAFLATHDPGEDPAEPGMARAHFAALDACWTALAQLATGEREGARDVIKFLSQTQDVTGKVLTRASTSGLAQYEGADPTALYLLLAARYGAWTGDLDFLRRWWPPLLRAYRWCLAADSDGDGIPEHRRAGRVWSERGPGGAPAVDISLAATWVAALEGLEPVATALGFHDLASELEDRGTAAREIALRRFPVEHGWAYAVLPDGTPVRQRGDQLAVPVILGLVSPESAAQWLDARAGEGSALGWVELSEAKAGRLDAALRDLDATAARAVRRHRGNFGGALPAALFALGLVEGLWGVEPDGLSAAVRVSPWLPPDWTALALERLRVGRSAISIDVRRHAEGTTVKVRRTHGPRLHLSLGLRGVAVESIAVDETPLGGTVARFEVDAEHEVTFHHDQLAAPRQAT